MVSVMSPIRITAAGERIVEPIIALAHCSKLARIIVTGADSAEAVIDLHRLGYARATTTSNCGLPAGQAPSFFRRTSGEVCAAITVLEDPRRITILEKHIARKSCWQAFFPGHFTAGIAHVGAQSRHRLSNPAVSAKSPVQRAADSDDHADNEKIPIAPFELRHELEVHAVDAGDRGRHREDGGPGR